jgi:hypothetical protein
MFVCRWSDWRIKWKGLHVRYFGSGADSDAISERISCSSYKRIVFVYKGIAIEIMIRRVSNALGI